MKQYIVIFFLHIVLFISGCKKSGGSYTVNNNFSIPHIFVIKSVVNKPITFYVYTNGVDYYNGTNVYYSGNIPANGELNIDDPKFSLNKTYYIDWYCDDFSNSNWMNISADSTIGDLPGFGFSLNHPLYIQANNPDSKWRLVLLDSNKTQSTWLAVDAKKDISGPSTWNQLGDNEKYKKVVFKKNIQFVRYAKDNSGVIIESDEHVYFTSSSLHINTFTSWGAITATRPLSGSYDTLRAKIDSTYFYFVKQ